MNQVKFLSKIILIVFITYLYGCNSKRDESVPRESEYTSKLDSISIIYYKLNTIPRFNEVITLEQEKTKNYLKEVYSYDKLQENKDSIFIYKDSIIFNTNKIQFLNEKIYESSLGNITVRKYVVDNVYSSSNLYFNNKNELLMSRSISSNNVVEYHNDSTPENIYSSILNDSIFFRPEW
ncbi:hypothetical protein GCM10007424_07720 [Flavobacterium suaedae]|uniref:LPS export ABC transporter periplasmic protein LptC n=1 Tax=Flavobacterium suaedae TaxID=1767027 RepID=A0ABQ1JLS2_9FLAO|nr:hypothetical protein [Flavobacterium suaedae]GGB70239.1 hypothetical protein GCM10007424_07720 [Flavobacterium suaedae]